MKHINDIFDKLDKWRHLPAYQLERRADIFFAIYLPDILANKFGVNIQGLIPEFPIRVGAIHPGVDINKSFKVDYLAKAVGTNTVMFVELKTDPLSRRGKQDWYLDRGKQAGLVALLEGVRRIYEATYSKKKYRHLLAQLQELGFITVADNGAFDIVQADYVIEVVYIQPHNPERQDNVITFGEVSQVVEKHGDDMSLRFSKSLAQWAATEAGEL